MTNSDCCGFWKKKVLHKINVSAKRYLERNPALCSLFLHKFKTQDRINLTAVWYVCSIMIVIFIQITPFIPYSDCINRIEISDFEMKNQ